MLLGLKKNLIFDIFNKSEGLEHPAGAKIIRKKTKAPP